MWACHNSRDIAYRSPYGAIQLGTSTELTIDLWNAPDAAVSLRTWIDGSGECIYPMTAEVGPNGAVRYRCTLAPVCAGIVWYHFIIEQADGRVVRYGARDGITGGEGQLRDWEPPSFQLTVYDSHDICPSRDERDRRNSQSLIGPVVDFLLGKLPAPDLAETIEALRENYPDAIFRNALAFLDGLTDDQLLVMLSGLSAEELVTDEDGKPVMDGHHMGVAKGRLWCASLMQMLSPSDAKPAEARPLLETTQPADLEADSDAEERGSAGAAAEASLEAGAKAVAGAETDRPAEVPAKVEAHPEAEEPAHTDRDCETILCNAWDLRNALSPFSDGSFECYAANEDVLCFWRHGTDGTSACVLINGSLRNAHDVFVPMLGEMVSDVVSGYGMPVRDASEMDGQTCILPEAQRYAQAHLYQIGSTVLYFHPEERLQQPMEPGLGVLAHITSLPADAEKPGTLGAPAKAFVDWLAQAGARYWQVLPVNPTDEYGSPYAGISAFAGNTRLMENPSTQTDEGPARRDAVNLNPAEKGATGCSSVAGNSAAKKTASIKNYAADDVDLDLAEYRAFCEREADWLEPYAAFMAIRQKLAAQPEAAVLEDMQANTPKGTRKDAPKGAFAAASRKAQETTPEATTPNAQADAPKKAQEATSENTPTTASSPIAWQDWPEKYLHFNPAIIKEDPELQASAEQCRRAQFEFQRQWDEMRTYANECGVKIVGDMPIYVSADSADVWANPDLFQLGPDGRPAVVAGCPPDAFAEEGQVWGNPVYDWNAVQTSGYAWWLRRLQRAFELYDIVRLDHFIGFVRYFCIPQGKKATEGVYRPGPGVDFFRAARNAFGQLSVIAEDLGSITPAVRALVAECGFPGMDIVQFVDGGDPLSSYQPRPEKVAYTGTHDNQTLVGYAQERYPDLNANETATELMEKVVTSLAPVAVLPLQDLMGLDDDARMNTPGTSMGNWTWQAEKDALQQSLPTLRHLVELKNTPR